MPTDDIREQLVKYLTDVHSTEVNAITQLKARELPIEETADAIWRRLAASICWLECRLRPDGACAGTPEVITALISGRPPKRADWASCSVT